MCNLALSRKSMAQTSNSILQAIFKVLLLIFVPSLQQNLLFCILQLEKWAKFRSRNQHLSFARTLHFLPHGCGEINDLSRSMPRGQASCRSLLIYHRCHQQKMFFSVMLFFLRGGLIEPEYSLYCCVRNTFAVRGSLGIAHFLLWASKYFWLNHFPTTLPKVSLHKKKLNVSVLRTGPVAYLQQTPASNSDM